jgi:hypothetical protein
MFFASNDTTFQPMNASIVSLNVLVDKYLVLCTPNGFGCPKINCFFMQQEFCVKYNGYHRTFALPSKQYFRNKIQMSTICQYLLVVNGAISLLIISE